MPRLLADKRLRVRGWIERTNGPMIHVTHLEQIEVQGNRTLALKKFRPGEGRA
jgi:hypothetical protein